MSNGEVLISHFGDRSQFAKPAMVLFVGLDRKLEVEGSKVGPAQAGIELHISHVP